MKRAFEQIEKAGLDTTDYRVQPSYIPRALTIQPRASVMVDEDMERHSHIRGARMIRKANERSSSEDGETMGRRFSKARVKRSDLSVRLSRTGSGPTILPENNTPGPSTIAATCFSALPKDMLFTIAEHCDRNDLLRFCLASKNTMEASIPHVYRHVDLSTHNRGIVVCSGSEPPETFMHHLPTLEHSDSVRCTNIPVDMMWRQKTFLKTLTNRQHYRKYVRVLIWTFLPPCGNWRRFSNDVAKPWDLMRSLENVRRFDLADLSKNWSTVSPRPSRLKGQYFPNASSVRLLGVMEPVIAASILSTVDPAKLVSLTLDNVQCCGKAPFGTTFTPAPDPLSFSKEHGDAALAKYVKWISADAAFVWPGLMRGLLLPLTGRCTGLKSLTLRKVGDRNAEEYDVLRGMKNERILLVEWASFIESVSGTLEEFRFEQGPRHEGQSDTGGRVHPVRMMDCIFGHSVFPVLLAGPWPRLKMMEVRGVRSWMGHDMRLRRVKVGKQYEGIPFVVSLEDQLKAAVGAGVSVVVEGEGRKFDLVGRPGLCETRMS